jgi:hypothetical protein
MPPRLRIKLKRARRKRKALEKNGNERKWHAARVVCIEQGRNPCRNLGGHRYASPPTVETPAYKDSMANAPPQSVVYIYDGMRRWWRIRRFQVMGALLLCVGIIVGMITGHICALLLDKIR